MVFHRSLLVTPAGTFPAGGHILQPKSLTPPEPALPQRLCRRDAGPQPMGVRAMTSTAQHASDYAAAYAAWRRDPEAWWAEIAEGIDWDRRWDRVFDPNRVPTGAGSPAPP